MTGTSYQAVMARRLAIIQRSTGVDYAAFRRGAISYDTDALLDQNGLDLAAIQDIQRRTGVGNTPLLELPNITAAVRAIAQPGMGARILVKDEAANPSGSFKDRRAAVSAHLAKELGYPGLVAQSSGNFGAAVASQAARHGLAAIIVQEAFDAAGRGQPEILEKGRRCEALGAEVIQTTVGPELFYLMLRVLEETGYYNASLYVAPSVRGIETLGYEIATQCREAYGRDPDAVVAAHAGGGMVSGTARGLRAAGAAAAVIGASVDLTGIHMASDTDFNRKSFTTAHTGFSLPFTISPDRVDVPHNAARPLRYLDRFVLVTQGEVFFATELLARLEGLERGPAGNTSLAAAIALAREMPQDQLLVVTETEYTGAGKSPVAQLNFALRTGIEVVSGRRTDDLPGTRIVIPADLADLAYQEVDLDDLRARYLRRAAERAGPAGLRTEVEWLAQDINWTAEHVRSWLAQTSIAGTSSQ